jgi:YD repeat-containing protein
LARHRHDAGGLRRQKQVAGTTTRFVWDDQDVLLETNGDGATQAAYTQTPDVYELLHPRNAA